MKCNEKAGFIVPRPCRTEATVQCPQCQQWVCGNHTAALQHGGLACTSCAAAQNVGPGVRRRQIYENYGYGRTWFGGYHGFGYGPHFGAYTHSDYDAFARHGDSGNLTESFDGS